MKLIRNYLCDIENLPTRAKSRNIVNSQKQMEIRNAQMLRIEDLVQTEDIKWSSHQRRMKISIHHGESMDMKFGFQNFLAHPQPRDVEEEVIRSGMIPFHK